MSTVAPPPPPSLPTVPLPSLPTVTVAAPPPALLAAQLNAKLEGQVLAQLGQGQFQVQTPLGLLTVQSSLALPRDALLTLVVQALAPQVRLQIATIDERPAALALRGAVLDGPTHPAAAPRPIVSQPTVTLTAGSESIATVLRPPPGALGRLDAVAQGSPVGTQSTPPAPGAPPTGPMGSPAVAGAPALPGGIPSGPAPSIPGANAGGTVAPAPAAAPPASGNAPSPPATPDFPRPGTEFPVRLVSVRPPVEGAAPDIPRPGAAPLTPGATFAAVVLRGAPTGATVLATPIGELSLPLRGALSPGSQVTLEVTGPVTNAPSAAPPPATADSMILARSWPALDEAVRALAAAEPALAHHVVNQVLPRPDGHLAAGIQFFLMALRGGDLRSWFGDAPVRALDRVRPDLKDKLGDDFAEFKRVADQSQPGDWRTYLIPFHTGRDIDPIRLYLRGGRDEDDEDEKSNGSRFLVDVTLTRLGRIQLDGLVRQREKHMDLIVRSDRPFPSRMRTDIMTIFANAADVTGMKGGLSFQAEPPRFVEVAPAPARPSDESGVLV